MVDVEENKIIRGKYYYAGGIGELVCYNNNNNQILITDSNGFLHSFNNEPSRIMFKDGIISFEEFFYHGHIYIYKKYNEYGNIVEIKHYEESLLMKTRCELLNEIENEK